MTINDPIADMITALRNAVAVHKETVTMPYANLRLAVAQVLKSEGYIGEITTVEPEGKMKFKQLNMVMKYAPNGDPVIQGIRKVSKPGQRIYSASSHLKKVLGGVGISVVSTSQGLMTNYQAKNKGIGGEVLFKIW
jgi:small subunit ribosomal protein S8